MAVLENVEVRGLPVKVESIEEELRQLWEVDEARTNASLMNFAVYSERDGALVENSEMIREITREHACRAILIGLEKEQQEPSVSAWITAHCHLAHGQKSVCCEQISFQLKGRSRGRFRNTIFAHLQSDLPLVFWWQGDLSEMFSEGLYRRIDRLIVDSSSWVNTAESFAHIEKAWSNVSDLIVQDLAWTRTYHFRLAVAGLYDNAVTQESLRAVRKVKLEAHKNHESSALLMVAWFCELAGWERSNDLILDDSSEGSYRFAKANGELVDIEIKYLEHGAPLAKFEIIANDVQIRVSRKREEEYLHHIIECEQYKVDTHGPADSDLCEELVANQLSRGGKNALYKRVFAKFREL